MNSLSARVAALVTTLLLGAALAPRPAAADARARRKALATSAIGLGIGAGGGATAFFTRWDDAVSPIYVPTMVAGATLAVGGLLALLVDLVLPPARGRADDAALRLAVGHRFVRQRPIVEGHGAGVAAAVRWRGLAVDAALDRGSGLARERLDASIALPRPLRSLRAGLLVERTDLADHGVTSVPLAAYLEARTSLGRSRGRLRFGGGFERVAWRDGPSDVRALLVASAALELDVGRATFEVDYDHRKDGPPGGLYVGKAPGFLGSIGVAARVPIARRLDAVARVRLGQGVTTWTALELRF